MGNFSDEEGNAGSPHPWDQRVRPSVKVVVTGKWNEGHEGGDFVGSLEACEGT